MQETLVDSFDCPLHIILFSTVVLYTLELLVITVNLETVSRMVIHSWFEKWSMVILLFHRLRLIFDSVKVWTIERFEWCNSSFSAEVRPFCLFVSSCSFFLNRTFILWMVRQVWKVSVQPAKVSFPETSCPCGDYQGQITKPDDPATILGRVELAYVYTT